METRNWKHWKGSFFLYLIRTCPLFSLNYIKVIAELNALIEFFFWSCKQLRYSHEMNFKSDFTEGKIVKKKIVRLLKSNVIVHSSKRAT